MNPKGGFQQIATFQNDLSNSVFQSRLANLTGRLKSLPRVHAVPVLELKLTLIKPLFFRLPVLRIQLCDAVMTEHFHQVLGSQRLLCRQYWCLRLLLLLLLLLSWLVKLILRRETPSIILLP